MTLSPILIEGDFHPDQEKTYVHLPFDIPAGITRLDVEIAYTDKISAEPMVEGGNTIDLGLFDERGNGWMSPGFRGWSGSERLHVFISENDATPGYLAGPIHPGRWVVHLGLYKLAPRGCHYRIQVRLTEGASMPVDPPVDLPAGDLPASPIPGEHAPWLRGELHCHSYHSDGRLSPDEVVALARSKGLDFLALTDHNTIASQRALAACSDPGLILLRGFEVTTFKGHFNTWGVPDWIDFRIGSPDEMEQAIQHASALGGLTSCNHPKPYGPPWDYPQVNNYDCMEVWNGPWETLNDLSLEAWTDQLALGRRLPALGGSDFHRPGERWGDEERQLGSPVNWVYVPGVANSSTILSAIRAGHVTLSDRPEGPFLLITAGEKDTILPGDVARLEAGGRLRLRWFCQRGAGETLRLLDQKGVVYEQEVSSQDIHEQVDCSLLDSLYVRAELRMADGHLSALTNPIYLVR